MMNPECAHLLGVLIHDKIVDIGDVDAVGGLELGAVPLTAIAIAKAGKGSEIRGFMVRKEPKGRGGRKTGNPPGIEGSTIRSGDRVVLLEDVTTTGGSALEGYRDVEFNGLRSSVYALLFLIERREELKHSKLPEYLFMPLY